MKNIITLILILLAPLATAQTKIVQPDMDLGYWVTTADQSSMIDQMLASVPESTREMMRQMMEEQMKESSISDQCITEESLENFDQQIKEAFNEDVNCDFDVISSTRKKFVGELNCSGSIMKITTEFINSKRNESSVISQTPGIGETEITTVSEWQSSDCP